MAVHDGQAAIAGMYSKTPRAAAEAEPIRIRLPTPFLPESGWAIDVIDDCLFIGAYSKHMRAASPFAFLAWLDQFSGGEQTRPARLIDCVNMPLALPIFSIPTSLERMMDLLFGRLQVCMGFSIPGLVEACKKHGFTVRGLKNKSEHKLVHQSPGSVIKYKGKPLVIERNDKEMVLADGLFMRWAFHFQRPMSVIEGFFENA